jgi:membrane protein YqaA with SNARE-associated domain
LSFLAVVLFGLYSIPANSVLPIPHEPGLLHAARFAHALPLAIAGTIGAYLAARLDGRLVAWGMGGQVGAALRASRSWQAVTRWLMRAPFVTVAAVSFTGLPPIQAVRILVLAGGYSVKRFAAAVALGRFPRFFLLALLGAPIARVPWLMALLTIAFVAWPVVIVVRARLAAGELDEEAAEPDVAAG